jgi:hypothetical protein
VGVGGQRHPPTALPPINTRYPLYSRLGVPQGRSGRLRKISPSPGYVLRTFQPVASRYTDCATPPLIIIIIIISSSSSSNSSSSSISSSSSSKD